MKKQIIILFIFSFLNKDVFAQWQVVDVPFKDLFFSSILYTSPLKIWGYANDPANNYFIVTSNDGGHTFTYKQNLLKQICALSPLNDDTAFAVGSIPPVFNRYVLMKTIDGGLNWDSVFVNDSVPYSSLANLIVFSKNKLCILYRNSKNSDCLQIYTSDDVGATWQKVPCSNINFNLKIGQSIQISQVKDSTALINMDSVFLITRDNGIHWSLRNSTDNNLKYYNLCFRDTSNGIGVRSYPPFSNIHFTHDGGITWDSILNFFNQMSTFAYVNDSGGKHIYIAGGTNGSIFSEDDGYTWKDFDHENHRKFSFFNTKIGISTSPVSKGGNGVMLFTGILNGISQLNTDQSFEFYPNPTSDFIYLSLKQTIKRYEIFDYSGKVIKIDFPNVNTNSLSLSGLSKGLYLIKFFGEESNKFIKVIKVEN